MAKLIVFAYPFERMSGQATREKQDLVYNDNRNPLWNAPEGKQAALNFKPQMVLTYNSKTGKQSFRIQTKSIADNTAQARLRMACFGGAIAVVSAVKKNPTLLASAYDAYALLKDHYKSFTSFLTIIVRTMLKNKSAMATISSFRLNNPWVAGGTGTDVTISDEILRKFATYLCPAQIIVDDSVVAGVPSASTGFHTFVSSAFNNGDFAEDAEEKISYKGSQLYDGDREVTVDDVVAGEYSTTAPNA